MASSDPGVSAYRIVAPRWADSAFSGEGAQKYGGRWNSPGRRVVYLAGSRALAALEMLVHLTTPGSRLKAYRIFEVSFPASDVAVAEGVGDPRGIGDRWLAAGASLVLRVPSALVPEEPNYLLNPAHPRFDRILIHPQGEFRFDPRFA